MNRPGRSRPNVTQVVRPLGGYAPLAVSTRGSGNSGTTDTTSHSVTLPGGVTAGRAH